MKCPKCGGQEIHVWVLCMCYNCGYGGHVIEFSATQKEIDANAKFKKIIYEMHKAEELGLQWEPKPVVTDRQEGKR